MKQFSTGVCLFMFCLALKAQSDKIFVELNYNTFSHSLLNEFQDSYYNYVEVVDPKLVDTFPSNLGFTLGYHIEKINTSIYAGYITTGGKVSYGDFSGAFSLTQPLKGYTIGGNYLFNLLEQATKHSLQIGIKGFVTRSILEYDIYTKIGDGITEESVEFTSFDLGLGVNFVYEYPISFFLIRAHIGYDAVVGGKLKTDIVSYIILTDNSGKRIKTGWSGVRAGLGIAIPL